MLEVPEARASTGSGAARKRATEPLGTRRIALVIKSLRVGGAETQLVALATGLQNRGWRPVVITLDAPSPGDELASVLAEHGVPRRDVGMKPSVRGLGSLSLSAARRLARILREEGAQLVHSHMIHANVTSRLARLWAPELRVVSTVHNEAEGDPGSRKLWVGDQLYRWTEPLSDLTTCVCRRGVERHLSARASSTDQIVYVPNGIDTSEWSHCPDARTQVRAELGATPGHFVWLAVAAFRPEKDYPNLLRAFQQHAKARPDALLVIAGDGATRAEAVELARHLDLESRIRFLGLRRDVRDLMSAADAFVMSSLREGMPIVLLEASLCGLPVAATDVGGNSDVVSPSVSVLAPTADSAALARAMTTIASGREFGERARARVPKVGQEFALGQILELWCRLYTDVLDSEPRSRGPLAPSLRAVIQQIGLRAPLIGRLSGFLSLRPSRDAALQDDHVSERLSSRH